MKGTDRPTRTTEIITSASPLTGGKKFNAKGWEPDLIYKVRMVSLSVLDHHCLIEFFTHHW